MSKEQEKTEIATDDFIAVSIGDDELRFNVSMTDINQFINDNQPDNKVGPAYDLLRRTVIPDDKEKFRAICLKDKTPRGTVVMQIAGVLALESGAGLKIAVKKSSVSLKA